MYGLKGSSIQSGIAQGLTQAGSSLLNASMVNKQMSTQQEMNRRLLAARFGWASGLGGMAGTPSAVRPAAGSTAENPSFQQQVGNVTLPAFAPPRSFANVPMPGTRVPGADLLTRLEE